MPIIFPEHWVHADIELALKSLGMFKDLKVNNAGECQILEINVFGKSATLGAVSNPSDKLVIETHDYLHGYL